MSYKNNTTNLFSHLERHQDEYVKFRKPETTSVSSKGGQQSSIAANFAKSTPPLSRSGSIRHKKLVYAVGMFVIKDMRPLPLLKERVFIS